MSYIPPLAHVWWTAPTGIAPDGAPIGT
jgi:hypothetical protein